jgi:hypothetical protein
MRSPKKTTAAIHQSSDSGEMVSSPTSPNQNYDGFGTCGSDDTNLFPALGQNHRNTSPVSSLGSPTQDDARRALDLVWSYFRNQPVGILEPGVCATIGKLMAQLSHNPDRTPIDRSLSPRVSKKRTIDGIYSHDRVAVQRCRAPGLPGLTLLPPRGARCSTKA